MTDDIANPGEFTITLIDESKPTVDGRVFEPGTVEWREPPLPLMFLTDNVGDGHKGSKVGGSIQKIWRDGDKIKGAGVFDSGEFGQEMRRMIGEGTLNGVSADVGGAIVEQELAEDGTAQHRIMRGRIMGATVLPFPAFDDTRVAVVASAVPEAAPREWFANPQLKAPTPLTVTRDGQVFGHAALWKTCHIGKPNQCLTPPHSPSDYAYFHTGQVLTADGAAVSTGAITLGTGHAGLTLNSQDAAAHYDHTGTAIADVVAGEDAHGIWVAGAIRPGIPDTKLHELRASALSGDWRTINGRLDLVALLAVNVPGFPVPRTRATFADDAPLALVAAGVASDEEVAMSHDNENEDDDKKIVIIIEDDDDDEDEDENGEHNDPTSSENMTEETPHNAMEDSNEEPLDEETALQHRMRAGELASCGDSMDKKRKDEELSDEEIEELTAKLDQLELAIISLASTRIESFAAENAEVFRTFSDVKREKLTKQDKAMPGGRFPIVTVGDLHNAIQSLGRAKNPEAAKVWIKQRAKELKAEDQLPESWKEA